MMIWYINLIKNLYDFKLIYHHFNELCNVKVLMIFKELMFQIELYKTQL